MSPNPSTLKGQEWRGKRQKGKQFKNLHLLPMKVNMFRYGRAHSALQFQFFCSLVPVEGFPLAAPELRRNIWSHTPGPHPGFQTEREAYTNKLLSIIPLQSSSNKVNYSPFHKTLPNSCLQLYWISVRFNEMGDFRDLHFYIILLLLLLWLGLLPPSLHSARAFISFLSEPLANFEVSMHILPSTLNDNDIIVIVLIGGLQVN